MEDRIYEIAMTMLPGVGYVTGRRMLAVCGSPELIFREKRGALLKIAGVREEAVRKIRSKHLLHAAERELRFVNKHGLKLLFFQDADFPFRLKQCEDSPLLLYYKGMADLDSRRIVAVVGTRNPTAYGKEQCVRFVDALKDTGALIISGLAYGIDSLAHRRSLDNGMLTVGVLGHGFQTLYPSLNRSMAEQMTSQGGLLTEFRRGTRPDRENFPKRNRIVAGLSDAVLVIESAERGGALITADIALSYNRDVFALPGKVTDQRSSGCNWLIFDNKAALVRSPEDMFSLMSWDVHANEPRQINLFEGMNGAEREVAEILKQRGPMEIESLLLITGKSPGEITRTLMQMELNGQVSARPGNVYALA
ncbi:MAG: DNA-processing protein DprA [Bacteroidales bacterium]